MSISNHIYRFNQKTLVKSDLQCIETQLAYEHKDILRFNPKTTSPHLTLSASNLVCISKDSENLGWAIANEGYTTGTHYWEVICPISCEGIQIGIVQDGFNFQEIQSYKEVHFLEFKTTTQRTIGVKLDLDNGTLRTWLNGNYNEKKNIGVKDSQKIKAGKWYPAITLKFIGNQVYLNPYGVDPEESLVKVPEALTHQELKIEKRVEEVNTKEIQVVQTRNRDLVVLQEGKLKLIKQGGGEFRLRRVFSQGEVLSKKSDLEAVAQFGGSVMQDWEIYDDGDFYSITKLPTLQQLIENAETQLKTVSNFYNRMRNGKFKSQEESTPIEDKAIEELKSLTLQESKQEAEPKAETKENPYVGIVLQSIPKLSQLLSILYSYQEQLTATRSLNTCYGRLLTFIDQVPPSHHIEQLAQLGYYQNPAIYTSLKHYNLGETDIQFAYHRDLQNSLDLARNVPLHVTLNSFSPLQVPQGYQLVPADSSFVFLRKDNVVMMVNAELKLTAICQINLRERHPKQKREVAEKSQVSVLQNIHHILLNYNETKTITKKVEQEEVQVDSNLLQQLHQMGFSLKICKQAILKANNENIQAAIDEALQLQDEEKESTRKQERSSDWMCKECTFLNAAKNTCCEICEMEPPPETEVIVFEQEEKQEEKEKEKEEHQPQQEDKKEVKELGEVVACRVQQVRFGKQLVVTTYSNGAVGFKLLENEHSQWATLDTKNGEVNLVTNEWQHTKSITNENTRYVVEALGPLFDQVYRYQVVDEDVLDKPGVTGIATSEKQVALLTQHSIEVYEVLREGLIQLRLLQEIKLDQPCTGIHYFEERLFSFAQNQIVAGEQKFEFGKPVQDFTVEGDVLFALLEGGQVEQRSLLKHIPCAPDGTLPLQDNAVTLPEPTPILSVALKVSLQKLSPHPFEKDFLLASHFFKANGSPSEDKESFLKVQTDRKKAEQLPLTVHSHTGSQFNQKCLVSKILYKNEQVFTPNYPNSEFLFRHQFAKRMCVEEVVVGSALKNQNLGFPIGSGLIFVSDTVEQLRESAHFAEMDMEEYKQWRKTRTRIEQEFQAWEPVGCFEFTTNDETVSVRLDVIRECYYVLLKPTNFRKVPYDNSMHFKSNPLEIKLFEWQGGVLATMFSYGTVVAGRKAYERYDRFMGKELVGQLKVEAKVEEKWERVALKEEQVQVREQFRGRYRVLESQQASYFEELVAHGVPAHRELELVVSSAALRKAKVAELRVSWEDAEWELVMLAGKVSVKESEGESAGLLIQRMSQDSVLLGEKYAAMDFERFVQDGEYGKDEGIEMLNLFKKFDDFSAKMKHAFLQDKVVRSEKQLENLMKILEWLNELYPEDVQAYLINEMQRCVDKVQHCNVTHFDEFLFKKSLPVEVPHEQQQEQLQERDAAGSLMAPVKNDLQAIRGGQRVIQKSNNYVRHFTIDLLAHHRMDSLVLRFAQNDKQCKLRIQVWGLHHYLYDLVSSEQQYYQFSQLAYTHKHPELLELPLNHVGRYLVVQVTFGLCALCKKTTEQLAQKSILVLPEVKGQLLDPICHHSQDYHLNSYFEAADFKPDGDFQQADSLYYDKYENKAHNLILLDSSQLHRQNLLSKDCYILNPQVPQPLTHSAPLNQEQLKSQLHSLQSQLKEDSSNSLLLGQIELLQNSIQEGALGTSFYSEYLLAIIRTLNEHPLTLALKDTLELCIRLFTLLNSYPNQNSQLVLQSRVFLQSQLIAKLTLEEWISFIFHAYDGLMSNPNTKYNLMYLGVPVHQTLQYIVAAKHQEHNNTLLEVLIYQCSQLPTYDIENNVLRNHDLLHASFSHTLFNQTVSILIDLCNELNNYSLDILLLVDLLIQLIRVTPSQYLNVPNDFMSHLIRKLFRETDYNIISKFKMLISTLLTIRTLPEKYSEWSSLQLLEPSIKAEVQNEQQHMGSIKQSYIQQFNLLIEEQISRYTSDQTELSNWISQYQLLVEFALQLTLSAKKKQFKKQQQQAGNQQLLSQATALKLIQILNQGTIPKLILQNLWTLSLRLLTKINFLPEIFSPIIEAYLALDSNIQSLLLTEILSISSNIKQELLENILLNIINSQNNLPLIKGWFTILPITNFIQHTSHFLINSLNVGSKQGMIGADIDTLNKLQIAELMLKQDQSRLDSKSLQNLLLWSMLNLSTDASGSPAFDLLKNISQLVFKFLEKPPTKDQHILFEVYERIYSNLIEFISTNSINTVHSYSIIDRSLKLIEQLFDLWISSSHAQKMAPHVFKFLIAKIRLSDPNSIQTNNLSKNTFSIETLQQEEFAKNVKIVSPVNVTSSVQDWSQNKKGVKSKIILMPAQDETVLHVKLESKIEVSSIHLAFTTYSTDLHDKIVGIPPLITLEIGSDPLNMVPVGEMQLLNDEFYSNFQVRVFTKNFDKYEQTDNLKMLFASLQHHQVNYVKFRIRKPIIQMLEGYSRYSNYQNVHLAVNFLSINGYNVDKLPQDKLTQIYSRQKLTAFNLISKVCAYEPHSLLEDPYVIQSIQQNFPFFLQNLAVYNEQLTPLLLMASKHIGDWIVDQLLNTDQHSKLINDIILSDFQFERLLRLHDYIIKNTQFTQLVESFCTILLVSAKNSQMSELDQLILPTTFKQIQMLIDQNLIKLVVTLTYLPSPYCAPELQDIIPILEYVHSKGQYEMLAPLVIGSEQGIQWFLQKMDVILATLDRSFLEAISQSDEIVEQLVAGGYVEQVYELLKANPEKRLTNFLANVMQRNENKRTEIVKRLISDLSDKKLVEQVLVPLLNSEERVPVAINILQDDKYVHDIRILARKVNKGQLAEVINPCEQTEYIKSQLLNDQQKQKLQLTGDWELVGSQNDDGDEAMYEIAKKRVFNQSSYCVLIEGRNPKNVCTFGLINKKPIQINSGEVNNDESYDMPWSDDGVVFYIDEGGFDIIEKKGASLGNLLICEGYCQFVSYNDEFYLSYNYEDVTSFNRWPNFQFSKIEYWVQKQSIVKQKFTSITGSILESLSKQNNYGGLNQLLLASEYHYPNSVYNYFRQSPIYMIPKNVDLHQVGSIIQVNGLQCKQDIPLDIKKTDMITDLDVNGIQVLENLESNLNRKLNYTPVMPIFKAFEEQQGVKEIIKVVKESIQSWSSQLQEKQQIWLQFIEELWSFCYLPSFFNQFMLNKQCIELLFQLLGGVENQKYWEQQEQNAVKFIYGTLIEVFKTMNNSEVRELAIERELLVRILDRIAMVSKEQKRQYEETQQEEEDVVEETQLVKKQSEELPKKPKKKKGVGYGSDSTGQNSKWNTQEYVEKKKQRNIQLQQLLSIIEHYFDYSDWKLSAKSASNLLKIIYESALLPLLESAFRSGSLLEMTKESDLYKSYLKIVQAISKHKALAPIFLDIPKNYVPSQTESVQTLLTQLRDNANIFLSCLNNAQQKSSNEQEKLSQEIAHCIIDAYTSMENVINKFSGPEDEEQMVAMNIMIQEILNKPLPEAYKLLLKDLRFDYVSMKDANNRYKHHYQSSVSSNYNPPQAKLVRLAQEFADMSAALPIEHTNSIFMRADRDRVDVLKALVTGSKGTPYAHGAYVFDIFIDDNYPNGPPKMNLATTGNGKIRFNPNLYSCGKVCLSLLGTWRGHASENWDPKISTLLQVLVSTQAIIMSEDVYFNEPGFEGEAGTEEGERKNEAYSNIVRYGNIKFAMIEQIRNPPKGFEQVIKRHFYLKKDEIMEEVNKWVRYSETRTASYTGLINDHNSNWCSEFKQKNKFQEMLKEAVRDLEKELSQLQPPTASEGFKFKIRKRQQQQQDVKGANLDEVDVTYDKQASFKEMNVNDESVRDRWSRYIGAMGLDAVQKQANSNIFVSGMGALGVEISKNIVLSGVKRLTIHDSQVVESRIGQFFLDEKDVGKNRSEACLDKIQQLNYYVKVDSSKDDLEKMDAAAFQERMSGYHCIVLCNWYSDDLLVRWSEWCRKYKIRLIIGQIRGVFGRVINDWGEEFEVIDKDGEQMAEVMIKHVDHEKGVVSLLGKHDLQDDDVVLINNVVGMLDEAKGSVNGQLFKVRVMDKSTLQLLEFPAKKYSAFERNGTVKGIKVPVKVKFQPVKQLIEQPVFDDLLLQSDFTKMDHSAVMHRLFHSQPVEDSELAKKLARLFAFQNHEFPPLAAFLGGFISQEVVKSITNKFMPVKQMWYLDCTEVLDPNLNAPITSLDSFLGPDLSSRVKQANVFMVGCGAIGCELLKNFAMIDLSTKGQLTITDPDHIETSNLNRQFLFREKHLRKPKSVTAAAAVIQMNPALKGKVVARLDKVHEGTESIYSDKFFQSLSLVANALDNVQARRYVDRRCVDNKKALLESGTLGPKGHVQCIIPYVTESYGSQNDPIEEGEIPYCTLKMFPEETFHCVEFARDKFSKLFTLKPKASAKIIEDKGQVTSTEVKQMRECVKMLQKRPKSYDECVRWARLKFQKYFHDDIRQLLYTYPVDHKTKEGKLFWTMPKRPPTPLVFDSTNALHATFVSTFAYLRAKMYGLQVPPEWRSEKMRYQVANQAATVPIKEWQPSEAKKQSIASEVAKTEGQQEEQETNTQSPEQELASLKAEFDAAQKCKLFADEFEKDNDQNGHIDSIYSFGNLRASNYKLEEMEWLTVKIKAGRIVPALATTTAVIAGLQTIELVKVLKGCKLEEMKNAFVNLAIPFVQLTEPGTAQKIKLNQDVSVTIWDRWEIKLKAENTLKDLFKMIEDTYKLNPVNVFWKSQPVYMETLMSIEGKEKEKQEALNSKLRTLLELEENDEMIDLTVNCTSGKDVKDILQGVPTVRLVFEKKK